ncbi:hypothetical protein PV11_01072 [Exophiala sideris]|uniref:Actin-like ATPase domain-containing protein n=1 Tax=Exophiala sideris TaxID=1016849 RepID=A0A0D1YRN7_9EURO|nr:hypothetical protein PV11_01072 [Exophiala sideris]
MSSDENILGMRDDEWIDKPIDDDSLVITKMTTETLSVKPSKRKALLIFAPLSLEQEEVKRVKREEAANKRAERKVKIICAIDMGTTYIGMAYGSTLRDWNQVKVVSDWGSGPDHIHEKAPSRIAYQKENPGLDSDKTVYEVRPGMISCQWTKLLLDPSEDTSGLDDPLLEKSVGTKLMHIPIDMTAQEVYRDILKRAYQQIWNSLEDEMGEKALEKTSLRFVITLPAGWSLKGRVATRQAARDAGFGGRGRDDIVLIDEAEAAMCYAVTSILAAVPGISPFQAKTCAVCCDLGGGTIDVCTYKISSIEPLKLEEACVGQGGKAGSTSIDRALHELMQNKFGIAFEELDIAKVGAGSAFMEAFEGKKRGFQGNDDRRKTYYLPLKMTKLDRDDPAVAASYDFTDDMVKLTGEEMESLFETVVEKTFQLLATQVKRTMKAKNPPVKTVVLCGGLGSSPYMMSQVQSFIDENLSDGVELVRPERPWSAICRGAVISHLGKSPVTHRRARDHIGICWHVKFDPDKHEEADKYYCPHQGLRAKNQMKWCITRGQKMSQSFSETIPCYAVMKGTNIQKDEYVAYQHLYICSRKNAPDRVDDPGVRRVATMRLDLTKVVNEKRQREGAQPPSNMSFNMDIQAKLGNDKGILEVVAKGKWKKYGEITLEYEVDPAYKEVSFSEDD